MADLVTAIGTGREAANKSDNPAVGPGAIERLISGEVPAAVLTLGLARSRRVVSGYRGLQDVSGAAGTEGASVVVAASMASVARMSTDIRDLSHTASHIAEPVIGRAFARPVGSCGLLAVTAISFGFEKTVGDECVDRLTNIIVLSATARIKLILKRKPADQGAGGLV